MGEVFEFENFNTDCVIDDCAFGGRAGDANQACIGWVGGFSVDFGFHVLDVDLESEVVPVEVERTGDNANGELGV